MTAPAAYSSRLGSALAFAGLAAFGRAGLVHKLVHGRFLGRVGFLGVLADPAARLGWVLAYLLTAYALAVE